MKFPDWHKHFYEVEHVALKGAHAAVRGLYGFLRSLSPGTHCEDVTTSKTELKKHLRLGNDTITKHLEDLRKRKLLRYDMYARKDGISVEFIFDYKDSTIKKIKGQVIIYLPNQEDKNIILPEQEVKLPNQEDNVPIQEELPYIDREKEHIYDALREQISKQLDDLGIFERIYKPVLKTQLGAEFVQDQLQRYPNASGPVMREKITDSGNFNEYKVIDMFRREGAKTPQGTVLRHFKTGEEGEWEWVGKMGYVRLKNESVPIDNMAAFRAWSA